MSTADCPARLAREDRTIARALRILERRVKYDAEKLPLNSPEAAGQYLRLRLDGLEREEFWCVFLDAQHRVIDAECMFVGTLTQTSVHPREIVRAALLKNAASVIVAHNHPSGSGEPSGADVTLTATLKDALKLVDVRLLDHLIIGASIEPTSLARRGVL